MYVIVLSLLLFVVLSCASVSNGHGTPDKETPTSFQGEKEKGQQIQNTKETEKEPDQSQDTTPSQPKEELSREDFASFAFMHRPDGYFPLHRKGAALMVLGNIDGNEYTDAAVLYVKAEKREETEVDRLSDISRLYDEETTPFSCMIGGLLQSSDSSIDRGVQVSLGEKIVFADISPLFIRMGNPYPLGVSVEFQDTEGFIEEWVIFTKPDTPYRFTLRNKPGLRTQEDDINGDGIRDVLLYEQDFEEGTGYETFITWYRWNGNSFVESATTNVVRNLNAFLKRVKSAVFASNWKRFIDLSLPEGRYPTVQRNTNPRYSLFENMFLYVETISGEKTKSEEENWEWESVQNITFPEILENPFNLDQGTRHLFPMEVRVVYREAVILYRVYVEMAKNPFQGPQFWFVLGDSLPVE